MAKKIKKKGTPLPGVIQLGEVVVTGKKPGWMKLKEKFEKENNLQDFVYKKPLQGVMDSYANREDLYNSQKEQYILDNLLKSNPIKKGESRGDYLNRITGGSKELSGIVEKYKNNNSATASNVWNDYVSGGLGLASEFGPSILNTTGKALKSKFDKGVYSTEEINNQSQSALGRTFENAGKAVSPMSIPYNATSGRFYSAVNGGDKVSLGESLAGRVPSKEAPITYQAVTDPLNFIGLEGIGGFKNTSKIVDDVRNIGLVDIKDIAKEDNFYRIVHGEDAYKDILNSGMVRTKTPEPKKTSGALNLSKRPTAFPSFSKGKISESYANGNPSNYIIESNADNIKVSTLGRHGKGTTHFPVDEKGNYVNGLDSGSINVYQHIRDGKYKKVIKNMKDKPKDSFTSEIDWSKWNEEIPNNQQRMEEYLGIEKRSKESGNWMKDFDLVGGEVKFKKGTFSIPTIEGRQIPATPEQFIQMQSENFRKAYPNGFNTAFRGHKKSGFNEMTGSSQYGDGIVFLGHENQAKSYTNKPYNKTFNRKPTDDQNDPTLFQLAFEESPISKTIDNPKNTNWRNMQDAELNSFVKQADLDLTLPGWAGSHDPNFVSTDQLAHYIKTKNLDYGLAKNVEDIAGALPKSMKNGSTLIYNNNKKHRYLKSIFGNNGDFDVINSQDVFKTLAPIGAGAVGAGMIYNNNQEDMGNKKIKKKYLTGGKVQGYMKSPNEVLAQNQLNYDKAEYEAATNPFHIGLDVAAPIIGNLAGKASGMYNQNIMDRGNFPIDPTGGVTISKTTEFPTYDWDYIPNSDQGMYENIYDTRTNIPKRHIAALGGLINQPQDIEAEGQEIVETPDGEVQKLRGPSHENGGIDLTVPSGTKIYSKRLKGIDGKTMNVRKENRDKVFDKLTKKLSKDPNNKVLKTSVAKFEKAAQIQDQLDIMGMEEARKEEEMKKFKTKKDKFKTGGVAGPKIGGPYRKPLELDPIAVTDFLSGAIPEEGIMDYVRSTLTPIDLQEAIIKPKPKVQIPVEEPITREIPMTSLTETYTNNVNVEQPTQTNNKFGANKGDFGTALGLLGTGISTFAPYLNAMQNRAGDQVHKNLYENYGEEGLAKFREAYGINDLSLEMGLTENQRATETAMENNRLGARGINTSRALDLAAIQAQQQANNQAMQQYYGNEAQLKTQEASLIDAIDSAKIQGEGYARQMNDADRDAHYNARGVALSNMGTGIQQFGKHLGSMHNNDITNNILSSLYKNYKYDSKSGTIAGVPEETVINTVNNMQLKGYTGEQIQEITHKAFTTGEYIFDKNTGNIYDKGGKLIVKIK